MARHYLILLIALIFISSCSDIFSTRDPEDPNSNTDIYISETVPELIVNFKTALLSLDKNQYEAVLIDSFTTDRTYSYYSNAEDISQANIFDDWGIENEKLFINGLKTFGSPLSNIELRMDNNIDETRDSLSIEIDYYMNYTDTTLVPVDIKGIFTFQLIKIDGHFWYVEKWVDEYYDLSDGEASFSSLKEQYIY